ncbi:DUF402 domain-containing protein [Candidatus Bathyarchaeota archaeon]|nr:DUF402 domain-containing protein [Candidatus Bathyarchaeota archaeon]
MSKPRVMIRGIYTTALTKLLSDRGFLITHPSLTTVRRFGFRRIYGRDVLLVDRSDRQGVRVEGVAEHVESVVQVLVDTLPDVVVRENFPVRPIMVGVGRFNLHPGYLSFDIEFPYGSKRYLDRVRGEVTATIEGHHQLKIVDPDRVDAYESMLNLNPGMVEDISAVAKRELIYDRLTSGRRISIHHVKPDGSVLDLGEADIQCFEGKMLTLKRMILGCGSTYDGLNVPKSSGDYALTFAEEGSWVLRHAYYSCEGVLKGEFYNINTPIEFYPDSIRYMDLEVDVVRRPNGDLRIIDVDRLDEAVSLGYVSSRLSNEAKTIASRLYIQLSKS